MKEGVRIGHREYVLLDFVCEYDRPIYTPLYVCLSRAQNNSPTAVIW